MTETRAEPVRLEISLVGESSSAENLKLSARYVATNDVVVFHRMLSGRYPDELELHYTDSRGTKVRVDRIIQRLPVANQILEEDFVAIAKGTSLDFNFMSWGAPELAPGEVSLVVRHVGGIGHYRDEKGQAVDAGAYIQPLVSNPIRFTIQ